VDEQARARDVGRHWRGEEQTGIPDVARRPEPAEWNRGGHPRAGLAFAVVKTCELGLDHAGGMGLLLGLATVFLL
jgi:hypothetical protein